MASDADYMYVLTITSDAVHVLSMGCVQNCKRLHIIFAQNLGAWGFTSLYPDGAPD